MEWMQETIKPCPFCGRDVEVDQAGFNPAAYWDSMMRGEEPYYYILCYDCGCIMKNNDRDLLIKTWNQRRRKNG